MNTIGNEFTVSLLEDLISKIELQLADARADALNEYPNVSYQVLDQFSVALSQLQVSLKLSCAVKKLELGITSAEEHIAYLNKRIADLENFYFIAEDKDVESLEKSIMEIKKVLVKVKRELYQKCNCAFELGLDHDSLEMIKQVRQP